jgi:ABC-type transport system involved in cytochrome bd biosynthesis fused ATPase/permease subunit
MKNKKEELTRFICRVKRKSAYVATVGIIALFASIMLISVSGILSIASAIIASLAAYYAPIDPPKTVALTPPVDNARFKRLRR